MNRKVVITCVDNRKSVASLMALARHLRCQPEDIFGPRYPGGIGVLTKRLQGEPAHAASLLATIKFLVAKKDCKHIIGTIHGVSEEDRTGCGAYIEAGHGEHFADLDHGHDFVQEELREAVAVLQGKVVEWGYPEVKVEGLAIVFDRQGNNLIIEPTKTLGLAR
jgi:hypothetical protein